MARNRQVLFTLVLISSWVAMAAPPVTGVLPDEYDVLRLRRAHHQALAGRSDATVRHDDQRRLIGDRRQLLHVPGEAQLVDPRSQIVAQGLIFSIMTGSLVVRSFSISTADRIRRTISPVTGS